MASPSAVLRTASTLASQHLTLSDDQQAQAYELSAKTADDLAGYQAYLQNRIQQEQSTGSPAADIKAIDLSNKLVSAIKSNGSSDIQRENINIMAGNGTLTDKYNAIVGQYGRAVSIGDDALAQSLMSQAYSVSQSIQYQNQQAAQAAQTLAKASATAGVTDQGAIVTGLKDAMKAFEGEAQNASEQQLNSSLKTYVQNNADVFKTLGVNIATDQPNYWDVVSGIVGAVYNHTVLQAQAEAPINMQSARNYAYDAMFINTGQTKFDTLGGTMSFQDIQQAAQTPGMFAYDSTSGKYSKTTQTGYTYQNFMDATGKPYQALVPTYSGMVGKTVQGGDNVYFLSPTQTTEMHALGLNFSETSTGKHAGYTGNGVAVQSSQNTPDWLKGIMGQNGVANFFTDANGNLVFKGAASGGQGDSFYTLSNDANGNKGLFEHLPNGNTQYLTGDPSFNAAAASMLLQNTADVRQIQTVRADAAAAAAAAAKINIAPNLPPPQQIAQPPRAAPTPNISVPHITPPTIAPHTVNPQGNGANPQGHNAGVPGSGGNTGVQGGNVNLMSGGGGIQL